MKTRIETPKGQQRQQVKQETLDRQFEEARKKSMEWFLGKTEIEKIDLKNKYFADKVINHSQQWGFHFTFGQIEEMYRKELNS